MELINKIRDALRNPSLEWHVGTSHVSNMLDVGEEQGLLQGASLKGNAARSRRSKKSKTAYRQCYLRSSGEMKVGDDGFLIDGRVFRGEELVRLAGMQVIRRLQWVEGTEWQQEQVREVIGK